MTNAETWQRISADLEEAMRRFALAVRPAFVQINTIARQPAFQTLMLEAAMRTQYADDLCEPEEDVFV